MNAARQTALSACFLCMSALSLLQGGGCTSIRVKLSQVPPGADGFTPAGIEGKVPAYLESVRLFKSKRFPMSCGGLKDHPVNGTQVKSIDISLVDVPISSLKKTRIFSHVFYAGGSGAGDVRQPRVTMNLTIRRRFHEHFGENMWRSAVVGASLFILDPIILLHASGDSTWVLSVERWDGATKEYKAVCAGDSYQDWFRFFMRGHDERPLFRATRKKNITSLMSQLVADAGWFAHSGATSQP